MLTVLGVDLGSTKIAVAPVDQEGVVLAPALLAPTPSSDANSLLAGLGSILRRALSEFEQFVPGAVGLSCAGTVDAERGEVIASPNLPLRDAPLAAMLQVAAEVPVVIENDGNAAVLGEVTAGMAVGLRNVVMLTLGMGVAGGLFLDGRLYRGSNGVAGELGHMVVQAGGLPCRCGNRGCLEMYASGPALARYASARVRDTNKDPDGELLALREQGELNGAAVTRLAREGHAGALDAIRQLADWLGIGLTNLTNTFAPQMIVVGGGVSDLGEMILHPARALVNKNAMPPGRDEVRIETAKLGSQAGLVGGALAAWEKLGGRDGLPSE